jgi:SAM-dependent methyltransferase
MTPLEQHRIEIEKNLAAWAGKPLLRKIYAAFHEKILRRVDPSAPGAIVEIGAGIGQLKTALPQAVCTDVFAHPWIDVVCDAYDMPFHDASVSHLILFDVFHHLRAPGAFFREARRVLAPRGKVILVEPFISLASYPVYAWLHHEPVAMKEPIDLRTALPRPLDYYAAQGNATRIFFRREAAALLQGWQVTHSEAFSAFAYLLSGGYSKPALYPPALLGVLQRVDGALSRFPRCFAARCLIELQPNP